MATKKEGNLFGGIAGRMAAANKLENLKDKTGYVQEFKGEQKNLTGNKLSNAMKVNKDVSMRQWALRKKVNSMGK